MVEVSQFELEGMDQLSDDWFFAQIGGVVVLEATDLELGWGLQYLVQNAKCKCSFLYFRLSSCFYDRSLHYWFNEFILYHWIFKDAHILDAFTKPDLANFSQPLANFKFFINLNLKMILLLSLFLIFLFGKHLSISGVSLYWGQRVTKHLKHQQMHVISEQFIPRRLIAILYIFLYQLQCLLK